MLHQRSVTKPAAQPDSSLTVVPAAGLPRAPAGLVARFRQRLFPPSVPVLNDRTATQFSKSIAKVPAPVKPKIGLQASLAELLLVNRLKARVQPDQAARMLERASHIIFVTCKHWFSSSDDQPTRHETRL